MIKTILKYAVVIILLAGTVALGIFGIIDGIKIAERYFAESLAIGSVDEIEKNETVIATFDFGMDYTFTGQLSELEKSIDPIEFDGDLNEYVVRFNGHLCDVLSITAYAMHVQTYIQFVNLDGELDGGTSFNIHLEFASLATSISVNVINNANVDYINNYVYNNGLKIEVCKKEVEPVSTAPETEE